MRCSNLDATEWRCRSYSATALLPHSVSLSVSRRPPATVSRTPKTVLKRLRAMAGGSALRRNFVRVAGANVIAQLLLLAAMPLLARLYSPEAFGLAAFFQVALQGLASIASLAYERTVPNSRSPRAAAARMLAGAAVLALFAVLLAIVIATQPRLLALWRGAVALDALLWWLPLAITVHGLGLLVTAWHVRRNDMSQVSAARVMQSVAYVFVAFVGVAMALPEAGLILATCAAWAGSLLMLLRNAGDMFAALRATCRQRVWRVFRLSAGESSSVAGVQFVNAVSLIAPVLFLAQRYSPAEVGLFALMMQLVGTPLTTITNALAVSFWSHSVEFVRQRRFAALRASFLKTTLVLAAPALAVVAFCLLAPPLIPFALGEKWRAAGPVLMAVAPMLAGRVLFSPTNHLIVLRRQRLQLFADGTRLVLMALTMVAAEAYDAPFVWAVLGISLASLTGHTLLFLTQLLVHRSLARA